MGVDKNIAPCDHMGDADKGDAFERQLIQLMATEEKRIRNLLRNKHPMRKDAHS